ncbi:MAG: hypothetical protein ACLQBJ_15805 [Bryobacteraceae bacterium]
MDSIEADQAVWAASDRGVRIIASKPLLEEMRAAAYRARFGNRRAGVEIGGVLYGRCSAAGMELHGWAPIDCGCSYGPSFHLTGREQGALACLLDGLKEELAAKDFEVLGWFVSRLRGERVPAEFDSELHKRFFSTPGSLLCVLQPRREGGGWTTVHVYESESQRLVPCDPLWVIDPAVVSVGERSAASRAAMVHQEHALPSLGDGHPQIENNAIQPLPPPSEPPATAPRAARVRGGAGISSGDSHADSALESVPRGMWRLLALVIVLTIGGAAWLWLFESDVVRPVLLRWTSSASVPPSSVSLTARRDQDRLTVQWDGRSAVFLNPVSAQLVFEFADAEPTTVPLRPDEAERGYFTTLTDLSPSRVTMIVVQAPGHEFTETFFFPVSTSVQPEASTAGRDSRPRKPAPRN